MRAPSTDPGTAQPLSIPRAASIRASLRTVLLLLASIAPAISLFAYVRVFAVDVPVADSWEFVWIISSVLEGNIPWAGLVGLHVGYPYAVPRLLMLPLALVTGWNTDAEKYLIAALLVLETGLLCLLIRHAWPSRTLVLVVPVAWLICNLKQSETLLITWNLGLVLSNVCLIAAVITLTIRPDPRGATVAAVCGFIGSLSFGSGLLIWPALLVWFAHHARWSPAGWRPAARMGIPCLIGVVLSWSVFLWLRVIDPDHARFTVIPRDVLATITSILQLIGYVAANDARGSMAVGSVLLAACGAITVLSFGDRRFSSRVVGAGLALIAFALFNAATIVLTRIQLDAPRYVTITVLVVTGLYLILLAHLEQRHHLLLPILFLCLALATIIGIQGGLYIGDMLRGNAVAGRYVVQTYTLQHHSQLIYLWAPTKHEYMYQQIPLLQRHRLSAFRAPSRTTRGCRARRSRPQRRSIR